mmetsp:Transcript_4818/g.10205  ORF Transcript_4818/g.10205 Transcript_4818/m.10205 type:complete len:104 (-) Transcript_4818:192-503(-)
MNPKRFVFGMNPTFWDGPKFSPYINIQYFGMVPTIYSSRFWDDPEWDGPETIEERGQVLRGHDKLRSMGQVNKFCGDQYKFWLYIFLWFIINEDSSISYPILI